MEPFITKDILWHLMMNMDYNDIIKFVLDKDAPTMVLQIYNDQSFWKTRVGNEYQLYSDKKIDWKKMYYLLVGIEENTILEILEAFFEYSYENGLTDFVDLLLIDGRIELSNQAIISASKKGHLDIVNRLLQDPRVGLSQPGTLSPSAQNNQAIASASENGHLDIVNRLLQDHRVDPSDADNQAIILASKKGHLNIVNRLLQDPRVELSQPGYA